MSPDPYALAADAAEALRERFGIERLDTAFVLGSGWSAAAEALGEPLGSCALTDLPGFSAPTSLGHGGELRLLRTARGRTAAVMTGRTHLYEGLGVAPSVHGVRTVAAAGATTMVLTNGCGSVRREWTPGTVVLIADHLNLSGSNPLVGGRFVDLTAAYSARLRDLARHVEPGLAEGVYAHFAGPSFETPAEVRMAAALGADLVGMSTSLETIAAREAGVEVLGISLVTNLAAGISPTPLSAHEVLEAGAQAAPRLRNLLTGIAGLL